MKTSKLIAFLLLLAIFLIPLSSAGFFSDLLQKLKITGRGETSTLGVNISVGNTNPEVQKVQISATESISEGNPVTIDFNFTVYDLDGAGNIDSTTGRANFTRADQSTRENTTCMFSHNVDGNSVQFNCSIVMWYWDEGGQWNITAAAADQSSVWAQNTTQTFTLGTTTSIVSAPSIIQWASMNPGSTNETSSNDPLVINNTGNYNVSVDNVQVTALNLNGEDDPTDVIWAANFSSAPVNGTNAECANINSTLLANNTAQGITGSTLPRGNLSIGLSNESLWFCLRKVGSEISSQSYSTARGGTWTIGVT